MNKGLKNYTKQISSTVENAGTIFVNVNKKDANAHVIIPLLSSVGAAEISTSLVFNYQDRATKDDLFGNGIRLNWYGKLAEEGTDICINNADGSKDVYKNEDRQYKNKETGKRIVKTPKDAYSGTFTYTVRDKERNSMTYDSTFLQYPQTVNMKSGEEYTLNFIASPKTISNGRGDQLRFFKNSNSFVHKVAYYRNNVEVACVNLTYTNNCLTELTYMKGNTVLAKTGLTINNEEIALTDKIGGHTAICTMSGGRAVELKDGYGAELKGGSCISIAYDNDTRTCLTNENEENTYVVFDNDGLPLFEMNSLGQVVKTVYDKETKVVLGQSMPIYVKNEEATDLSGAFNCADGIGKMQVSCTDTFSNSIIGQYAHKYSTNDNEGNTKIATYIQNEGGIATDSVMAIICCKQLTGCTNESKVGAKLTVGEDVSMLLFDKTTVDDNYDVMILGVNATKTYDNVKLELVFYGNAAVEIGSVQILKKEFGSFYTYDATGNIEGMIQGGSQVSIEYDKEDRPISAVGPDGTEYTYEADNYNNIIKAWGAYGVKVENEYDTNVKSNLTKQTISNVSESKKIVTSKQYNPSTGLVAKETDELGNITAYEYNSLGNVKKITDAMGAVTEFGYENDVLLKTMTLKDGSVAKMNAQYEYDTQKRIKKITLANGSEYEFEYDGMGNITAIKINGKEAYKYTYDGDGRLVSQEYGNGDKYIFGYENGMIKTVSFKGSADTDATLKYQYAYDDKKRVESVSNGTETLNTFEYDDQNRIVKQTGANSSVEKTYDNLGNVATQVNTVDGYSVYQSYEPLRHSRYCNTKSKFGGFTGNSYVGDFSRNAKLIYKDTLLAPITHDGKEQHDIQYLKDTNGTPYVKVDKTHLLSYKPDCEHIGDIESGNVQFWFKTNTYNAEETLFSCKSSGSDNGYIEVYLRADHLSLRVKNFSGEWTYMDTQTAIKVNEWNFFALNFQNREGEPEYLSKAHFRLTLNEETVANAFNSPITNVCIGNPIYNIGHGYEGNNPAQGAFNGGIACLRIMPRMYTSAEQEQMFYSYSKQFIEGALVPDEEIVNDVSATNVFALTPEEYNTFEVYPLQKDLLSLKGKKPVIFDCASNYKYYHSRTFEIDEDTKRYAYYANMGKLAYRFENSPERTIMMRAKTIENAVERQILEIRDAYANRTGIYVDSDNKLVLKRNNTLYTTQLNFTANEWHTIGVAFKEAKRAIGYYDIFVQIMLDDNIAEILLQNIDHFRIWSIMIGRTYYGMTVANSKPFRGYIEMLAVCERYLTLAEFQAFAKKLNCMSKMSSYDEFGMLTGEDLIKDGVSVYSKDITYKSLDKTDNGKSYKQISHIVAQENINAGGRLKQTTRQYTTDSFGRVTGITDNLFGSHTYAYDKRGFLTSADGATYEYDANGNITKLGNTTLTYDSVMKDRLASVDGKAVSYATDSSICPTAWNGINYTFEGRRLVGYGVSLTKTNILFEYNDKGLRTKKVVSKPSGSLVGGMTSTTTEYFYDGDKLIFEKRGTNTRLDYLYDENGSLYGFVYNKTDKYFYVRDVLQNILGIIDSNGTLVVRYKYNAWGKKVLVQDATQIGIGEINPFRFKGYYYDTETGMFYCQSRYYVPEWGRWLCGDHPNFLEPQQLNKSNLFLYCGNDPINNVDPSGQGFLTLLAILATLAIGTLVSAISEGVAAEAAGGDFWAGFAGGAVSGFISTVGVSFAVALGGIGGLIIAGITGFAAGFTGNIVQQGIEHGWENIDYTKARLSGYISIATNIFTYVASRFVMRACSEMFQGVLDKSMKYTTRVINAMKFAPAGFVVQSIFMPVIIASQIVAEIAVSY